MSRFLVLAFMCFFLFACADHVRSSVSLAQLDVDMAINDMGQNHLLAAKAQLLQALQVDADDAEVQAAWGYYLALTSDESDALLAYQKALALCPDDAQINDDYAVFLYHSGHYQEALKYFLVAARDPHYLYSALAYQNASLAAKKLGMADLAYQYALDAQRQGLDEKKPSL